MIPEDLKKIFGLKDTKDLNMANNIWKMLDQMSQSDPQQYKKFIQKNMKEGFQDVKQKKEEKQKPFKIKPITGFCLKMTASINQKPLESSLNQKVLITKLSWSDVRSKFESSIKLILTVTHTERIKLSKSKSTKKEIQKYSYKSLSDIELFYYSLQGPLTSKQQKGTFQFCMILNSKFYQDILSQNAGKKLLMSLCISYLQERLSLDKNPLLNQYNPDQYKRLAFYSIDKYSLQISQKEYVYDGYYQPQQFLLEKQIDIKRENQENKQVQKQQPKHKPQPQIKFKQQKVQESELPLLQTNTEPKKQKKVLIEVLKEESNQTSNQISYNMKQTEVGYFFQFLLPGVASIKEVDLEMKKDCIRLKTKDKKEIVVQLNKLINEDTIKAKLKKNQSLLKVQAKFH